MMRAPGFWWREEADVAALMLAPLGAVYGAVTAGRMARRGVRLDAPVICVGNFVAGGAGKTPTAIAIGKALRRLGERPFFLSRGYGATHAPERPLRVEFPRHRASEVGDEPLLLSRVAPTIVFPDRIAGAQAAVRAGATVMVMDDGLQNPGLHKDLAIAVVDGARGVGNGLCIPAGPLRAPLAAQFRHIDAVVVIGPGGGGMRLAQRAADEGLPVLHATLTPNANQAEGLHGARVVAFAGIGAPDKFYDTLRSVGADIVATRSFADHHAYKPAELAALRALAADKGARLVTTEKDVARIGQEPDILTLGVDLTPEDAGDFEDLLRQGLKRARAR